MESKNHICNKIMVSSFEYFLKSAIASCILIENIKATLSEIFSRLHRHFAHHLIKMKAGSYYF